MDALSLAGVPLYAERGSHGGWILPDRFKLNLTGFKHAELATLLLTDREHVLKALGLEEAAENAQLKLLAALPAASRLHVELLRERIHVDGVGWFSDSEEVPFLRALQQAVWESRVITIAYAKQALISERTVLPLGLVVKSSIWYLVAESDGQIKSFRVAKIKDVRSEDTYAERPAGFKLAEFWEATKRDFAAALPKYEAYLSVSDNGMTRINRDRSILVRNHQHEDAGGGKYAIAVSFQSLEHAVTTILSLGSAVKVLEPVELATKVREEAAATAAQYDVP